MSTNQAVALVTRGASGMGLATVERLARDGLMGFITGQVVFIDGGKSLGGTVS
ncbi:hypothetical protein [Pararobbsia silviterrae]|uniref:hypothetical protein n=1 Tax=Pararobbsia silviterrae TaxID=1792498 RepID=UPI001981EC45|nr:hypothetical protein [Pararobbsia silviterrae]